MLLAADPISHSSTDRLSRIGVDQKPQDAGRIVTFKQAQVLALAQGHADRRSLHGSHRLPRDLVKYLLDTLPNDRKVPI